jgi:hypothetical protein
MASHFAQLTRELEAADNNANDPNQRAKRARHPTERQKELGTWISLGTRRVFKPSNGIRSDEQIARDAAARKRKRDDAQNGAAKKHKRKKDASSKENANPAPPPATEASTAPAPRPLTAPRPAAPASRPTPAAAKAISTPASRPAATGAWPAAKLLTCTDHASTNISVPATMNATPRPSIDYDQRRREGSVSCSSGWLDRRH